MRKRASRSKRARVKLPRLFKIKPVPAPKKPLARVRVLVAGGPNPCPDGCECQGSINVGDIAYWVCVAPDGSITYVRKV